MTMIMTNIMLITLIMMNDDDDNDGDDGDDDDDVANYDDDLLQGMLWISPEGRESRGRKKSETR